MRESDEKWICDFERRRKMSNDKTERIEDLERAIEKVKENQEKMLQIINKYTKGVCYYFNEDGDLDSFIDD